MSVRRGVVYQGSSTVHEAWVFDDRAARDSGMSHWPQLA